MTINGMKVVTNIDLTITKWEFPYDRFCEYDESDLWWAVKYGFGRWVQVPSRDYYIIGGHTIVMHPALFAELTYTLPIVKMPSYILHNTV